MTFDIQNMFKMSGYPLWILHKIKPILNNLCRKIILNTMGHFGAGAHDPKASMPSASLRNNANERYKAVGCGMVNRLLWSDGTPSSTFKIIKNLSSTICR